jgi:hypothetical protein
MHTTAVRICTNVDTFPQTLGGKLRTGLTRRMMETAIRI